MTYAVIKNNIVENIILADEEFANIYAKENNCICISYVEQHEDDTLVARVGEAYIDNKFINANQAIELGLMTKEKALSYGFHSGCEFLCSKANEKIEILKNEILSLNPDVVFPTNEYIASIGSTPEKILNEYLSILKKEELISKFRKQ